MVSVWGQGSEMWAQHHRGQVSLQLGAWDFREHWREWAQGAAADTETGPLGHSASFSRDTDSELTIVGFSARVHRPFGKKGNHRNRGGQRACKVTGGLVPSSEGASYSFSCRSPKSRLCVCTCVRVQVGGVPQNTRARHGVLGASFHRQA